MTSQWSTRCVSAAFLGTWSGGPPLAYYLAGIANDPFQRSALFDLQGFANFQVHLKHPGIVGKTSVNSRDIFIGGIAINL
jgi:hypothetical protein